MTNSVGFTELQLDTVIHKSAYTYNFLAVY